MLCPREQMSLALTQVFLSFSPSLSLSVHCLAAPFPLYLHLRFFFPLPSPSFFFLSAPTRWRDAPLQTSLAQVHNAPSHVIWPAISSLSISFLFVSVFPEVFPLSQCPFPPLTKADKGLSFLPSFACALCVCTVPN